MFGEPGRTAGFPAGIRSVSKALMILEIIARSGGEMTLTAIAGAADLNISTCHHLLATLQEAGFVARCVASGPTCLAPRS